MNLNVSEDCDDVDNREHYDHDMNHINVNLNQVILHSKVDNVEEVLDNYNKEGEVDNHHTVNHDIIEKNNDKKVDNKKVNDGNHIINEVLDKIVV